jgi:hypothetical protein
VALLQVVPISEAEARYSEEHGPRALDARLEESGIDVCNLERESVI